MSTDPRHLTVDAMLAELTELQLERDADRLIAAVVAAEGPAFALHPDLPAALDANAVALSAALTTWGADMQCGDLPLDQAEARNIEIMKHARNQMYDLIGYRDAALFAAVAALHRFVHGLEGDTFDDLVGYVAEMLGDAGPRYVLGGA